MNIDEVESGKGLRFLPSDEPKKLNTEYIIDLVAYCKRVQIPAARYGYLLIMEDRDMYLGLSRWHYQQRRVRARREKHQKRIDQIKKSLPRAVILRRDHKARFGKVVKFTISEEALKPWQL